MWKAVLLALLVLNIGVPVNTYSQAAALGVVILLLASCELRIGKRSLLLFVVLFVACQFLKLIVAAPQWEEGSNLFAPNEINLSAVYRPTLPRLVLDTFAEEYARANPHVRCDRNAKLPWEVTAPCLEDLRVEQGPFAKSADAIFQRTSGGRLVRSVDIGVGKPLSAGFLFDSRSVWHTTRENPNRVPLAYYVAQSVPAYLQGSTLCWSGTLVWEEHQRIERADRDVSCRILGPDDLGERVWAFQPNESRPLTLRLEPSASLRVRTVLADVFVLVSTLLLLIASVRVRSMKWQPAAIYAASVILVCLAAPGLLAGLPGQIVNRDALLYLSWGRDIAFDLMRGDFIAALRGGEPVFVFVPGMRYFRAAEFFLFGDSGLGHALSMTFVPLVIYRITRELPGKGSLFVVLMVASLTMIVRAARTAGDGYSDPLGLLAIALAALLFLRSIEALKPGDATRPDAGVAAGFVLLALSIIVRPNFVLAGVFVFALWLALRNRRSLLTLKSTECFGIFLVLTVLLHNIVFGHRFVPLTLATELPDALTASPATYVAALGELVHFAPGENSRVVARKLASWWLPARWLLFFCPLLIAVLPVIRSRKLKLLAAIAFALQAPHLFFRSGAREMLAANYLALVAILGTLWHAWEHGGREWALSKWQTARGKGRA